MIRSALLILSGNAAASLLLLARNLIVARLIPVEDYGIAATFAVAMAVVEMMSTLGLQQQIVQSKDGDDPRFQAALQGFQLLRGVISAAVLYVIAEPVARFMGIPQVAWAYQVLALVPVLNALVHFDVHRLNRHMRFWPLMLTGGIPALVSLLAVWPLAAWFGDWQVMLWAILLQAAIAAITSHLVAERRWRIVFDRGIMTGSLRFGWPLLANGILLFLVFNGEKLIVGRELGMSALAFFAMGVTLTLTPTLVMAKSAQNFFLPQLSRAAGFPNNPLQFSVLANATLQASLINGTLIVVLVHLFGAQIIAILLGDKYLSLSEIIVPLAIVSGLRVFKAASAVIGLSFGRAGVAMVANFPRVFMLPMGWGILVTGGDMFDLIWLAALAELAGFLLSLLLLQKRLSLSGVGAIFPISISLLIMISVALQGEYAVAYIFVFLSFLLLVVSAIDLRRVLVSKLGRK